MTDPGQPASWRRQAAARIKRHWLLKMLGTPACMALFFVGYFWLLKHPVFPVTVMPSTGFDRLVGFHPWSIALYASLWLYISLVPLLLYTRRELLPYLSAAMMLSVSGFVIFFFWPTAVPKPNIDWAQYPSVAFLKSVDASGNACPSLHVAFAVLTGVWLQRLLKQMDSPAILRVLNACWCLGILYSTLATKQHVFLDLIAGVALALAVSVVQLRLLPKPRVLQGEPGSD
ncbi:MAG: phosphatase PAP2 family protein [Gammaproteobacteria bacterium]